MEMNIYQSRAAETWLPSSSQVYLYTNLAGEAGEVLGLYAKGIRDGFSIDYEQKLKKELGDVLWHVSTLALSHGFTLEDIAEGNLVKLASRKERGVIGGSGDDR